MAASAIEPAWAWLWGDEPGSSDVTLLVYPAGDGPDGAWTAGKPEPVAKLALHTTVLASVSPQHFRRKTHGFWKPGTAAARGIGTSGGALQGGKRKPAAKRPRTDAQQPAAKVLELTCFPGEPQGVPEAVVCHAYTGKLPDDPAMLSHMIARADYLDMAATVEACLAKLLELLAEDKLTVPDLTALSSLPALQTEGSKAAVEQAVASMAAKVLSSQLGSTRQVLLDQPLLGQLVQLPFPLFMQWARLESLEVDSENTMAVLITAWYDYQLSNNPAAALTEQQCKELSTLICLDKVTLPFHLQAMPHLTWFRPPGDMPAQHAVARVLNPPCYRSALASGGTARQQQGPGKATQEWSLSRQQLETLWTTKRMILGGDIYLAGFCHRAEIDVIKSEQPADQTGAPVEDQYNLAAFLQLAWPSVLIKHGVADHVPRLVSRVHASVTVAATALTSGVLTTDSAGRGWYDVVKRNFSKVEELVSFMTPAQPNFKVSLCEAA